MPALLSCDAEEHSVIDVDNNATQTRRGYRRVQLKTERSSTRGHHVPSPTRHLSAKLFLKTLPEAQSHGDILQSTARYTVWTKTPKHSL